MLYSMLRQLQVVMGQPILPLPLQSHLPRYQLVSLEELQCQYLIIPATLVLSHTPKGRSSCRYCTAPSRASTRTSSSTWQAHRSSLHPNPTLPGPPDAPGRQPGARGQVLALGLQHAQEKVPVVNFSRDEAAYIRRNSVCVRNHAFEKKVLDVPARG